MKSSLRCHRGSHVIPGRDAKECIAAFKRPVAEDVGEVEVEDDRSA